MKLTETYRIQFYLYHKLGEINTTYLQDILNLISYFKNMDTIVLLISKNIKNYLNPNMI